MHLPIVFSVQFSVNPPATALSFPTISFELRLRQKRPRIFHIIISGLLKIGKFCLSLSNEHARPLTLLCSLLHTHTEHNTSHTQCTAVGSNANVVCKMRNTQRALIKHETTSKSVVCTRKVIYGGGNGRKRQMYDYSQSRSSRSVDV